MNTFSEQIKRTEKELDYQGCRNCRNQIEPLRSCKWAENGGDGHLHLLCPMWERKHEVV